MISSIVLSDETGGEGGSFAGGFSWAGVESSPGNTGPLPADTGSLLPAGTGSLPGCAGGLLSGEGSGDGPFSVAFSEVDSVRDGSAGGTGVASLPLFCASGAEIISGSGPLAGSTDPIRGIQPVLAGNHVVLALVTTHCHAAFVPRLPDRRMKTGTWAALGISRTGVRLITMANVIQRLEAALRICTAARQYDERSRRMEDRETGSGLHSVTCHVHSPP